MSTLFATVADVQARFPDDAALLCADENTRLPDWSRFEAALSDVSMEIRIVLQARYTPARLAELDEESLGALKIFAVDMAMYRVAVAWSRTTDQLKARYDLAIARLEGIASGKKGALTFNGGAGAVDGVTSNASPGEALIVANERQFTRENARNW
jgi:phage gp36-like protein